MDQSQTKIFFDSRQFGTHQHGEQPILKPNSSYHIEKDKYKKRVHYLSLWGLENKTNIVLTSKFYDNSVAKYLNK